MTRRPVETFAVRYGHNPEVEDDDEDVPEEDVACRITLDDL